jgi:hypothetical protein
MADGLTRNKTSGMWYVESGKVSKLREEASKRTDQNQKKSKSNPTSIEKTNDFLVCCLCIHL